MSGNFYVYEHWRPDTDLCFWVGKGRGRRAYDFRRNPHYNKIIAKLARLGLCAEVRIVQGNMREAAALELECARIAFWRSVEIDLCNMTVGGEGVSGLRHSEASKVKMAARAIGRKASEKTREKMSIAQTGRKQSAESRAKLSASKIGKPQGPHTPEHNAKIGAASRGRIDPIEVRRKKREAALRRPPVPDDVKSRISMSVKKLWDDPEYRERLLASHANRPPVSEAAREKMRASQRVRRATELLGG